MLTVGFKGLTEKGNREFAAPGEIVTERYTDARNELFAVVCMSVLLHNVCSSEFSEVTPFDTDMFRFMNFALVGTEHRYYKSVTSTDNINCGTHCCYNSVHTECK